MQSHHYFSLSISADALGFSAAHFLLTQAEEGRLCGHNFQVRLSLCGEQNATAPLFDAGQLRQIGVARCQALHHKILLPGAQTKLQLRSHEGLLWVDLDQRRFAFPESDCLVLPLVNTNSDMLAAYFSTELVKTLESSRSLLKIHSLEVAVSATVGEWSSCRRVFGRGEDA